MAGLPFAGEADLADEPTTTGAGVEPEATTVLGLAGFFDALAADA